MRSVEAGGSTASHGVPAEDRWMGESGSASADPEVMVERGGPGAAPHEVREMSPLPQSRGQAQNGPAQTSWSRKLGVRPQNIPTAQQHQRKSPIPLFFLFSIFLFFSVTLCLLTFCRLLR